MSDLLSIGASGVRAYQTALATIGENVSNATTAGFTRRTVSLQQAPSGGSSIYYGNSSGSSGVRVAAIGRATDDYQAMSARSAASDAGAAAAKATWMANAETALGDDASGVGQSATGFFNAGDTLAANPASTSSRQAFLTTLDQTATAFRTTAGQLATVSTGIASAAVSAVQSVNASLDQLDKINTALHGVQAGTESQANLLDQRDQVLSDIAGKIGIDVSLSTDGTAAVAVANGGPTLVAADGASSDGNRLTLLTQADGRLSLETVGKDQSTTIAAAGGTIGGLVDSAGTVADRRQSLDGLASDFATAVNGWQANGTDATGATGTALLTGTTAATLTIATTDGSKVAAARGGTANGNLLALSGELRTSSGVEARWNATVTDQGQITANAKSASTAASARSDAATTALASSSGVDLDTEAAELVRYQQAYSGAAKVIQVARDTLQSILDVIN